MPLLSCDSHTIVGVPRAQEDSIETQEHCQTCDINGTDVQFLGQRGDSGGAQESALAQEEYQEVGADVDLPF